MIECIWYNEKRSDKGLKEILKREIRNSYISDLGNTPKDFKIRIGILTMSNYAKQVKPVRGNFCSIITVYLPKDIKASFDEQYNRTGIDVLTLTVYCTANNYYNPEISPFG